MKIYTHFLFISICKIVSLHPHAVGRRWIPVNPADPGTMRAGLSRLSPARGSATTV